MSNTDDGFIEAGNGSSKAWDKEGVLVGLYAGKKTNVGPNQSNLYLIEVEGEEEQIGVWGSTVLDGRFEEIPEGSLVKIECLGQETSKRGNKFTNYKVLYKKPDQWANDAAKAVDEQDKAA
jgi:hypothetical protein